VLHARLEDPHPNRISATWPSTGYRRERSVNLYICLVHPPRSADGPSIAPPTLFEFWKVALNPPQDRCVGHRDPSIRHHDHQISQTQFEARVPAHAQNDNLSVEATSFEQILDRDELVHLFMIARHPRV